MMKSIPFLLLAGFLILPNSLAQAPQEPQRPPDGGTREVLISILIPSLPNAPFTATVNTEWIRQLPDGSTITLKNHRAIARDAAGRIFQERRALVPDDGKTKSGVTQIEISGPWQAVRRGARNGRHARDDHHSRRHDRKRRPAPVQAGVLVFAPARRKPHQQAAGSVIRHAKL